MSDHDTTDSLRREIVAARARLAELDQDLARATDEAHRLEHIIEVVPGAVWESEGKPGEPGYRTIYVSGEVERIFGYTREECRQGQGFWQSVIHPDDRPALRRGLEAIEQTGGRLPEHRFVTKDGREVWVETHVTLNRDDAGKITGRCVVAPDVSERLFAERALASVLSQSQELASRLDNVIASVPGLVWEVRGRFGSPEQTPLFLSDYLTSLVGYRPEDLLRDPQLWSELTHPDDRARLAREVEQIHHSGSGTLQHRMRARHGATVWTETHLRVVTDETGAVVGESGVTMDITARKLAEQERARLKEQVIEAQAGALAEISTPLLPIAADILVMPLIGTIDDTRAAHIIETLLHGIARARAQTAILDVSGVREVDASTVDALMRAAGAATLLGARVVLTGIRPEMAVQLVNLEMVFENLTVCGSLEQGIAHATSRRR